MHKRLSLHNSIGLWCQISFLSVCLLLCSTYHGTCVTYVCVCYVRHIAASCHGAKYHEIARAWKNTCNFTRYGIFRKYMADMKHYTNFLNKVFFLKLVLSLSCWCCIYRLKIRLCIWSFPFWISFSHIPLAPADPMSLPMAPDQCL